MKTRLIQMIFIAIALLFVNGCAGNKGPDLSPEANRKTIKTAPEWYLNSPTGNGLRYESSTATSQDLQLAVNKAELDAANRLAGKVKSEMNALVRRAQEETGLGPDSHIIDQFSQTQEQVITTTLEDYTLMKKEVLEEKTVSGKIYRAYVLIEWDETAAHKRLIEKIKQDEQLYTLMRSTELFEEMERKVEEYRQRYGR